MSGKKIPITDGSSNVVHTKDRIVGEVIEERVENIDEVEYIEDDMSVESEELEVKHTLDTNHFPEARHFKDIGDDINDTTISLPHSTLEDTLKTSEEYLSDNNKDKLLDLTDEQRLALNLTALSYNEHGPDHDILDNIGTTEIWGDELNSKYLISDVKLKEGQSYKGDKAVLAISKSLGLNGWYTLQLPHTGITITLDSISEAEFGSLDIAIRNVISYAGRETTGLVFSNSTIVYDELIIDFILERVKNTSLAVSSMMDLKDHINVLDKPILIGGLLRNMYPNKFPYMTSCNNHNDKGELCGNSYRMDVSINSLYKFNASKMTPTMKDILSKRTPRSVTLDDLVTYKKELSNEYNVIKIGDVVITLEMPNITDSILSGLTWLDDMSMMINDTIDVEDVEQRQNNIDELLNKAKLAEYSNIIKSISVGSSTVSESERILDTLKSMMSNQDIVNVLSDGIASFITNSLIAVMGTKVLVCDSCGKDNSEYASMSDDFRSIVPISDMAVFLSLRRLKGASVQS